MINSIILGFLDTRRKGDILLNKPDFEYPFCAIFFLIPMLALVIMILAGRKKENILKIMRLTTKNQFHMVQTVLIIISLALITFSLLGPQIFLGYQEVSRKGMDIYVLIDTSKSMLVEDIKPNRLIKAKKIVEGLVDRLEGDRIGFIPFSADAYVQMPLTDDYTLAKMFLNVVDTDMISGGGTNIAAAIKLADTSFKSTSSADRAIIILSDGEELDSNSLDVLKSMKEDNKLKVYTIGTGTEKGGLIPESDTENNQQSGYKKDKDGNFVTSHLSTDLLKKLASTGNGNYYEASVTGSEINSILKDMSTLKRDTSKTDKIKRAKHLYQFFLGAGILLFLLGYFFPRLAQWIEQVSKPQVKGGMLDEENIFK